MRKIILASQSKARQKLLKEIGIRFQVAKSACQESRELKRGCASLVMRNAFKKAKDVAKRFQSGVVIGADTVVLSGNRLIGKPSGMNDAFRALKLLSRKPQWVYTGIAIVDIDNGRTFSDYEKTRIYMCPLNDRQIKDYFKKVSPFDKAGSFDIQGPGSIFIDRIEGCFYNVVGLPLAKLTKMLKKAGINVF